jgi:hypothetical protein
MAEDAPWMALCMAPYEGAEIGDLMRATGMTRSTIYRHLRGHVGAGRVIQVSRGRWRADDQGAVTVSDRLIDRLVSALARASARKRAYTADETNK